MRLLSAVFMVLLITRAARFAGYRVLICKRVESSELTRLVYLGSGASLGQLFAPGTPASVYVYPMISNS